MFKVSKRTKCGKSTSLEDLFDKGEGEREHDAVRKRAAEKIMHLQ